MPNERQPPDASDARFAFGENWREFLRDVTDSRINEAEKSLLTMLRVGDLDGLTFLDVGSGSGLFSLAAYRLGAVVTSFDYDPDSVACSATLRDQYAPTSDRWTVMQGSALDEGFLSSLGVFDIVYAWGVLHHTGDMWRALATTADRVKRSNGKLYLAIYNDQGRKSRWWRTVKQTYCRLPQTLKPLLAYPLGAAMWAPRTILDIARLKPFLTWRRYHADRGMSPWRDVIDWIGGFPFEVAKPEEIFEFFRSRGFSLDTLRTVGASSGCNEFVFKNST